MAYVCLRLILTRKWHTNLSKTEKYSSSFQNYISRHFNFVAKLKKYFSWHFNFADLRSQPRNCKNSCFEVERLWVPLNILKSYNIRLLKIHKLLFAQTELQTIQDKPKILIEIPHP